MHCGSCSRSLKVVHRCLSVKSATSYNLQTLNSNNKNNNNRKQHLTDCETLPCSTTVNRLHANSRGVVSGTTDVATDVAASAKKMKKKDLKDTAKKRIKTKKKYKGGDALGRQCLLSGCFCSPWAGFCDLTGPVFLRPGTWLHSGRLTCCARIGFRAVTTPLANSWCGCQCPENICGAEYLVLHGVISIKSRKFNMLFGVCWQVDSKHTVVMWSLYGAVRHCTNLYIHRCQHNWSSNVDRYL